MNDIEFIGNPNRKIHYTNAKVTKYKNKRVIVHYDEHTESWCIDVRRMLTQEEVDNDCFVSITKIDKKNKIGYSYTRYTRESIEAIAISIMELLSEFPPKY